MFVLLFKVIVLYTVYVSIKSAEFLLLISVNLFVALGQHISQYGQSGHLYAAAFLISRVPATIS